MTVFKVHHLTGHNLTDEIGPVPAYLVSRNHHEPRLLLESVPGADFATSDRYSDLIPDQTFYVVKPPAPPSSRRRRGDGRPRSKGAASDSAWPPCGTCPLSAADPCRP